MKLPSSRRAFPLAPVVLAALLAACGSGDDDGSTGPGVPTNPSNPSNPTNAPGSLKDFPKVVSAITQDTSQEATIKAIVAGMTVEQKVGQMTQPSILSITPAEVTQYYIGSVLNGGGAWPNNDKHAKVTDWLGLADQYWQASMSTDLKTQIPVIWGTDAVHGDNNVFGATLFPHNIGLGAANDPDLIEKIGEAVADQISATGIDWSFAPTLAVVQDIRWGRTYEGFSEDPTIVFNYGDKYVQGLQGSFAATSPKRATVLATAKHYIGDGGTDQGKDQGENKHTYDEMVNVFGAGYYSALAAGAQTVMASFNSWTWTGTAPDGTALAFDNVKMHGNKYLLTDVLKTKMGFDGLIVSDWNGIGQVVYTDGTGAKQQCSNTSCPPAINAGIDIIMVPDDWKAFIASTVASVNAGEIPMSRIDDAVTRILRVKMRAGLMSVDANGKTTATQPSKRLNASDDSHLQHRDLARQAVRESLVLLKNEGNLLPLTRGQKLLVVGKNADSIPNQVGGWSLTWQGTTNANADYPNADSVLAGIKEAAGDGNVTYSADGKDITDFSQYAAVIAVIGETPYAEGVGDIGKSGTLDHASRYPEDQAVIDLVSASKLPVVTVLESGRPVWVNKALNESAAFVAAWLPGTEGKGVADVLFKGADGKVAYDFKGKLSYSWPDKVCHVPLNARADDYTPLFKLGYGLTYAAGGTVGKLDETTQALGCGQSTDTGPAATDDLVVFDRAQSAVHKLLIGSTHNWAVPVGDDLNATVATTDNNLTLQTTQVNVQQDGKLVTWTGDPAQFYAQSTAKNDYSSYIVANAALEFDVIVGQKPQGNVQLRVDCGYPCTGTLDATDVLKGLPSGKSTVKIPLQCFAAKGTDFSLVDTPFLITTDKPFQASFANIRWAVNGAKDADALTCDKLVPPAAPALPPVAGPSLTLLDANGLTGDLVEFKWSAAGSHIDESLAAGVVSLQYKADGDNGFFALQSPGGLNLSNYSAGKMSFDVNVSTWGSATHGLSVKMESPGTDCRNVDFPVSPALTPADGQWHTITLSIADVIASTANACFTLDHILTPIGVFPQWGDQQGVNFQLRNISFTTQ